MWRQAASVQVVKTMLKIRANISKRHEDLEDERGGTEETEA